MKSFLKPRLHFVCTMGSGWSCLHSWQVCDWLFICAQCFINSSLQRANCSIYKLKGLLSSIFKSVCIQRHHCFQKTSAQAPRSNDLWHRARANAGRERYKPLFPTNPPDPRQEHRSNNINHTQKYTGKENLTAQKRYCICLKSQGPGASLSPECCDNIQILYTT